MVACLLHITGIYLLSPQADTALNQKMLLISLSCTELLLSLLSLVGGFVLILVPKSGIFDYILCTAAAVAITLYITIFLINLDRFCEIYLHLPVLDVFYIPISNNTL